MVLLQRLPGLGPQDQETGSRRFIDSDVADTARAGDVVRFVENPYGALPMEHADWRVAMGQLGVEVSVVRLNQLQITDGQLTAAMRRSAEQDPESYMTLDLVKLAAELGSSVAGGGDVNIKSLAVDDLVLDDPGLDLRDLVFRDCLFERIDLPRLGVDGASLPRFEACHFNLVEGRSSALDLPSDRFVECEYEDFGEGGTTTSQLLATTLPLGQRVALTVLKKLYLQSGSGRKEGALFRGLDQTERAVVNEVLGVLEFHKLALRGQSGRDRVWQPTRRAMARVQPMLEGPTTCRDTAWLDLAKISQ